MAGFCASCGAPLGEGKFCPKCGAAAPGASPVTAPVAATGTPAPGPTGGSGSVLKIVLIVLGVIALLVVAATGSCLYIGYRVKKRAEQYTQEFKTTPYRGEKNPCRFATPDEVGEALGKTVSMREISSENRCDYHYGPEPEDILPVEFTWEGGAATMKLTHGAMKGISGMETFKAIPGVGDEAYMAPMGSMLMFRKGDVMVNIDMRTTGLNEAAAEKIARIIAGRL